MLKPLAGFLFKLLLEKLNWILRQVRLRTGIKCPWCCWPCSGTKFFTPVAHIPLKTLLITNLSEVWVQKTQIEITLWCKRLNEWLILLWQLGVVCRSQPHCDYIIYSSHCWSSCSYQTLLLSTRASVNTACVFSFLYIIFILALISVFLRQRTEAKFCPETGIHSLPRAWSGAIGTLVSSQSHVSAGTLATRLGPWFCLVLKMLCTIPVLTMQQKIS